MTRLIFWRLVQLPFLLLVIYTVTFLLAWGTPGNPLEREGRQPDPVVQEAMRAQYNLDDPWALYWQYLGDATGLRPLWREGVWRMDFGPSLDYQNWRVGQVLAEALPVSIQLGLAAILLALFLGVGTGVLGAIRRGGVLDATTLGLALLGISLPTFVTGSALLLVFSLQLQWVPIGWGTPMQILLPALTLSLPFAAYIARLTRMGMIDVLSADHIRTAWAKGVSAPRVILRHALKVAFLPVLSFLGPAAAAAMTGSFVVEKVFNIPGMGEHFVNAVLNKDLFLIMGVVLVYSSILIVFNLLVDIAYSLVDPRIEAS
jgi:oligopeptide transport system permease protein